MSEREWKPGEVGVTGNKYGHEVPERFFVVEGGGFHYADGDVIGHAPREDARPLVVIDPEDAEQVERLGAAYRAAWMNRTTSSGETTEEIVSRQMRAALREFANPTPPKPEEPLGLGAVVVDPTGSRWVRVGERERPWISDNKPINACAYYEVNAVRVLSEGVTP